MDAVLVAGGAGYIGAHTCKALARAGYTPVTIDNLTTGYEAAVKWGPLVKADIRDKVAVAETVRRYGITSCIHFAAASLVGESMTDPAKYYDNNVVAGLALVEALTDNGVEHIVFSSTAATYGLPSVDLIDETQPNIPINPYGATKLAFEGVLKWMAAAKRFSYVVLRYFNAAGADPDGEIGESHEPETHLIPLVCKAALGDGNSLTVFGTDYPTKDGSAIRDYIHVNDLAAAHIAALERLRSGGDSQIYNLGTGHGLTVLEVMRTAERVLGKPVPHTLGPRRPGDPVSLVADVRRATNDLRWRATQSDLETLIATASRWELARRY
jgi:UDP-glucose-4-epimerase GalE